MSIRSDEFIYFYNPFKKNFAGDDTYDENDAQVAGKVTIYSVDETDDSWYYLGNRQFNSLGSSVAIVSIKLNSSLEEKETYKY